jgi:hypothetical protein
MSVALWEAVLLRGRVDLCTEALYSSFVVLVCCVLVKTLCYPNKKRRHSQLPVDDIQQVNDYMACNSPSCWS